MRKGHGSCWGLKVETKRRDWERLGTFWPWRILMARPPFWWCKRPHYIPCSIGLITRKSISHTVVSNEDIPIQRNASCTLQCSPYRRIFSMYSFRYMMLLAQVFTAQLFYVLFMRTYLFKLDKPLRASLSETSTPQYKVHLCYITLLEMGKKDHWLKQKSLLRTLHHAHSNHDIVYSVGQFPQFLLLIIFTINIYTDNPQGEGEISIYSVL